MQKPILKKIVLPVGWNALINAEKKTALVIGEYKYVSEANTALTLLTKPTEADLTAAIVAQAVDIPPSVATLWDALVEARNAIRLSTARRPESIAIGTPGPGCTLPPVR